MSKIVDERVVEMRFDNKDFESNVRTSMSTLEKLKQRLKLTESVNAFESINHSAKAVNLTGIANAIETVQNRFSALEIMGVTALANITNSAVNTSKKIVSALTIDPIKTGLSEYETQINAVQTILANTESKGTTIEQVNRALDELNTYADKTIYNFTEMTRNIGTFTAAGVDLDTSVAAIQGIANLAAVSGSSSQQASTAMYQLSQALAAGKVSLMDWNSVVNAGMGGQVFQDALKRTSEVLGTGAEAAIEKYGTFRESLTQGNWLTTEVLTETLKQFTMSAEEGSEQWESFKKSLIDTGYSEEQATAILKMANTATNAATKVKTFSQLWDTLKESAQSGWTQSWEIMIGDFEEAKKFLSRISDTIGGMIGESAEARNTMLAEGLSTGWKQLMSEGIADEEGYRESIKNVAKEHGVAMDDMIAAEKELDNSLTDREAFQKALVKGLKEETITSDMLSESVHKMAEKMTSMSEEELKAAGYTKEHIEQIKALSDGLKDGSISMDEFVDKMMKPSGRENLIESLWNAFDGLMSVITPIKEAFREIFPPITGEQLYAFTEGLRELTSHLKVSEETAEKIKSTFKGFFSVIDIGVEFIKAIATGAIDLVKNFAGIENSILGVTSSVGDWLTGLRDTIKETDIFGYAVGKVTGFISKMITSLKNFGKSVKDSLNLPDFEGFLVFFENLWNIIQLIGSKVAEMLAPIGHAFSRLFENANMFDILNSGLLAGSFVGISKLSGGFAGLIDNFKEVFDMIGGEESVLSKVKGILDDVRSSFEAYQKNLSADTLTKIATAIGILAAAIFVISSIDPAALDHSLGAIGVLFAELLASLALFNKIDLKSLKGSMKTIPLMLAMSTAVLILASAMKKIASLDWEGVGKGLVGVGALLAELSIFLRTFKFDGKLTGTAVGIVILSSAMIILSKAVENFGSMSWDEIGKGLTAIGTLLLELALFADLSKNANSILSTGVSMVLLAASMKILASAMKDFGSMSWDEIGKGISAMGIALGELAIALNIMPANSLSSSVGLLGAVAAMSILAGTMKNFGSMSWEEIGRGITVMGLALLELAVGLIVMNGTLAGSAAMLIAAGALAIMVPVLKSLGSMSWGEIGKGLVTLAGAFAVIGVAGLLLSPLVPTILGLAGAFALFGVATLAIGIGLTAIATGFTALAVAGAAGATSFVAALTIIVNGVLDLVPAIIERLGGWIATLCSVIGECAPQIAETLLSLASELLATLATYTPQIVDSLMNFLIGVMDSLAGKMPELITSAVNLIGSFFQGVVDALSGIDTTSLLKGIAGIGLMTILMYALSGVAALIPGAMVGVLGMGVVIAELALVLAAVGALAQIPGLQWLISEGGQLLGAIGTAIGQFIGGIVGGIAQGFTSSLPQIGTDLSNFMTNVQPFIDGASSLDAGMLDGVRALAETILILTAADILNGVTSWLTGGSSLADFGAQLVPFGSAMKAYSDAVVGIDPMAVTASATAAQTLATLANDLPNSGGIVSWFTGDNNLDDFAEKLIPFGKSMKEYSDAVIGIDPGAISASATAAKALSELANNLPNSGGMVSWFTGDNNIGDFAKELIPFGSGMKAYSDAVAGISLSAVTASVSAANQLVAMINSLSSIDTSGVNSFKMAINSLSDISIDGIVSAFSSAASSLQEVGASMMDSIVAGIESKQATITLNATTIVGNLAEAIDSQKTTFVTAGTEVISRFSDGVRRQITRVQTAVIAVVSSAAMSIKGQYNSFYQSGAYLVQGFAAGITANTYMAAARARAMANAASNAARQALDEHSPSRVFYEIGDFAGKGFVNALGDHVSTSYKAGSSMAESAKEGLSYALTKVNDLLNSDTDMIPTIRPVLDLSDVKSGASAINGMFGMQPSVGVMSNLGAISSMMNSRNQNGVNGDVVDAINKLNKRLGNIGNTSYTINGITYDNGSEISEAISTLVRAAKIERRV